MTGFGYQLAARVGLSGSLEADSQYLVKGMTEWLPKWVARGWRKAGGQAPDNLDLWKRLRALAAAHEVVWVWVKGHAGNAGNERADALANQGLAKVTS